MAPQGKSPPVGARIRKKKSKLGGGGYLCSKSTTRESTTIYSTQLGLQNNGRENSVFCLLYFFDIFASW